MDANDKPATTPASTHLAASNGYPPAPDNEPSGTTEESHRPQQPSLLAPLNTNANPNINDILHSPVLSQPFLTPALVPKLTYSNYTFWLMSLRLAAALYRCEDHVIKDPPEPSDPDLSETHRRGAAQAWLILTQSVPEEIRHQLTVEDLSSTPHQITKILKQIVLSRPENSHQFLMSRAQNMILRPGESMSNYLAAHDDIRQRMILIDHIKESDEATTILFILCGLRQNRDYSDVCSSLGVKSAASTLTLAELKHDLLHAEQFLKSKPRHSRSPSRGHGQGSTVARSRRSNGRGSETGSTSAGGLADAGNGGANENNAAGANGLSSRSASPRNASGNTNTSNVENGSVDGRIVRNSSNGGNSGSSGTSTSTGMWCTFHEVATHNTDQCHAKARHDAMANKWCSYHEVNTHNTSECKAKARQDAMRTKWCSFHESHSHNTDECEAKRRHEGYQNKWCSFHESRTHNTDECQAKKRHDALYSSR